MTKSSNRKTSMGNNASAPQPSEADFQGTGSLDEGAENEESSPEEELLEDLAEAEAEEAAAGFRDSDPVPDDAAMQRLASAEEGGEDGDDDGDDPADGEGPAWPSRGGFRSGGHPSSKAEGWNSTRLTASGDTTDDGDVESDDLQRMGDAEVEESAYFSSPSDGGPRDGGSDDFGDQDLALPPSLQPPASSGTDTQALVVSKGAAGDDMDAAEKRDLLREYLKEISAYPLLTREEEHALAVRYRETGDETAAWRLVTANLRLVVKIANEYRRQTMRLLDLIQEGNVGLMMGVQKYDPFRGVKLSSYASFWIRAYLLRYITDNFRQVKVGTSQAQRKIFFNLNKERRKLEEEGFVPNSKLLAQRLNVSESDVVSMQMRMEADEASLDAPNRQGDDRTLGEKLTLQEEGVDEKLGDEQVLALFKVKLKDFEATLEGERDKVIFRDRLTSENPRSLQSIGEEFGLTRERMRQIEARLLERMRAWFREEIPEFRMLEINPPPEDDGAGDGISSHASSAGKASAAVIDATPSSPKRQPSGQQGAKPMRRVPSSEGGAAGSPGPRPKAPRKGGRSSPRGKASAEKSGA